MIFIRAMILRFLFEKTKNMIPITTAVPSFTYNYDFIKLV